MRGHPAKACAAHLIEHSDTPGGAARSTFTCADIPIVTGIILAAVGAVFMLVYPTRPAREAAARQKTKAICRFRRMLGGANLQGKTASSERKMASMILEYWASPS